MKNTIRNLLMAISMVCGVPCLASAAASASAAAAPAVPPTVMLDACSWNRPGVNPFMGDVVASVDRYGDIPVDVRTRLKARMAKREYDDLVSIRRDSIQGANGYDYGSAISDMHFGTHQVCRSVTRTAWSPTMEERGLVYCESGHCILVPTVCRNVSRISRKGVGHDTAGAPLLLGAPPADGLALADLPPLDWFGPTGAGLPADPGAPLGGMAGPLAAGPGSFSEGGSSFANGFGGFGGPGGVGGLGVGSGSPGAVASTSAAQPGTSDVAATPAVVPTVTPVPEPRTWALMLGGLGAIGALARRRRAAP